MSVNRLFLVFIFISLYAALMTFFPIASGGVLKIFITLLLWITVALCVINYSGSFRLMRLKFDAAGLRLVQLLLLWNLTLIARGFDDTLTTALGNPFNALAFFAPFVVAFAVQASSLYTLNRFLLLSTMTGLACVGIFFLVGGLGDDNGWFLVYPVIFLIGSIGYVNRMTNYAITASSILLSWNIGLVLGSRATVLKVILLYFSRYLKGLPQNLIALFVFPASLVMIALFAFQAVFVAVSGEESVFEIAGNYLQALIGAGDVKIAEKADTRTFLYFEVIGDLVQKGGLWLGRGSSGTYFSSFFSQIGEDSDTRLTVEVGFLAYLIKGGIFSAALNIGIFLFAAYLAVYKSNSQYMKWVGLMLVVHVFILFVENLVALNMYNLCIWLFVGFCFSKDYRALSDRDIKLLLLDKKGRLNFSRNKNA